MSSNVSTAAAAAASAITVFRRPFVGVTGGGFHGVFDGLRANMSGGGGAGGGGGGTLTGIGGTTDEKDGSDSESACVPSGCGGGGGASLIAIASAVNPLCR